MKLLFNVLLFFASAASAIESDIPNRDYGVRVGLGNKTVVSGDADKESVVELPRHTQPGPNKETKVDYANAIILKFIKDHQKQEISTGGGGGGSLMALPGDYTKRVEEYKKFASNSSGEPNAQPDGRAAKTEKLLFLQCKTFEDYKINLETGMKALCRDAKDPGTQYKLRTRVTVNERDLVSVPYLLEDDNGVIYHVVEGKSRLFNATNGSTNLATYVDRRAMETVTKAGAGALAASAPVAAKDYIEKDLRADSTVYQDTTGLTASTTTETINPKPKVGDYGISVLVDVLSAGLKAGVDQLYMDLGYIYFIPRDTVIDAEITIEVAQ